MTTAAAERMRLQGAPAIGGRRRPTSAVSGGDDQPSGDGRVQYPVHKVPTAAAVRDAVLSPDGTYRYTLTRRWGTGPRAVFAGLNPSTADAAVDDPSTRRMIGFAQSAGCGSLTLVNLYAWRSASPAVLRRVLDPVGPDNDAWIATAATEADLVIAAWGTHAGSERAAAVLELLGHATVWCLGRTKAGHPRHPLYVPAKTPLELFQPATHDWEPWRRVIDSGLPEPLRERSCLTCGADEVDVDHDRPGGWS